MRPESMTLRIARCCARQRSRSSERHNTADVSGATYARAIALAVIASFGAARAASATWPERPIRVIVPLAPGGGTDIVARLFTPRLSGEFGQQFIVDNRAGAGGTVGAEIAARANPDGYTVAVVPASYAANA